ncbi:MAG: prolyl-tRNA synthetase associated domain-containing protein [Clostridiaceae bacterium]|jgi:Ala-tRNA(Pro) deacylase|nr:prolyl-tRNA synthetase associated domain-containing protein [Clostridiaceae bacterium]
MTENESKVYDTLNQLGIPFIQYEHPPVYTIPEIDDLHMNMQGEHCKNLFVRNDNGNKHYLVLVSQEKKVDLKNLAKQIGSSRLSFASEERLMKHLGLTPGAVTIFGLLNDEEKKVIVIIDESLKKSKYICVHPNVNTASVSITYDDLVKFLKWRGNEYSYVKI